MERDSKILNIILLYFSKTTVKSYKNKLLTVVLFLFFYTN